MAVIASIESFDKNGKGFLLETAREYFSKDGYSITRLNYKKQFKSFNRIFRRYENFYYSIEKENPSIIFIHNCQFWDIKQVVKYIKLHKEVKVFVDNHADFNNSATNWISKNILHKIIWKFCAKSIEPYAYKFYGVTPLRCDFLKNVYKISASKIELLILGSDDEKIKLNQRDQVRISIRKELSIPVNDFVMITGGKIDERKNIHLLMQAVKELGRENVKLIIFGTSNQQMKPIIENLGRSNQIRNIGWIESDKVYDYFLASDLAVFPGTHSVLWEQSVGTGIPGVFKYWKGMDHIDLGGNCKFLYKDNANEIKIVLEEIIRNEIEFCRMKKITEEIGISKFSYSEISKRSIQI
ncbi:MAG: glycosyltransferase [Bacteroidia bacterium]|nr:glycosyltransferase [Bacteroidia bacterium]